MKAFVPAAALAACVAVLGVTGPAAADGVYYGPNGGSAQWQGACYDGVYRDACHRSWTATGPNGNTYSGGRTVWRGPWSVGRTGHVAGPGGAAAYGTTWHRRW